MTFHDPFRMVVNLCWLVFLLYWAIGAARAKATVQRGKGQVQYRLLILAGFLLIVGPWPPALLAYPQTTAFQIVSDAIAVAGTAFAVWARSILARNWSSTVTIKQDHELITAGPYRYVRHPIYTGMTLMTLGTALIAGTPRALVGFVLVVVSFWIKLRQEEMILTEHFGEPYTEYVTRTKALIPFVL